MGLTFLLCWLRTGLALGAGACPPCWGTCGLRRPPTSGQGGLMCAWRVSGGMSRV